MLRLSGGVADTRRLKQIDRRAGLTSMVDHLVLFRFRRDVSQGRIAEVFETLRQLTRRIEGISSFRGGAYNSPEGLHHGFTHGFVMTFESAEARDAYLPHPAHQELVARLLPLLEGGLDGALAFDLVDGVL